MQRMRERGDLTIPNDQHEHDLSIPIYRRPVPETAEDIITKLRDYGWTPEMMTPEMMACIQDIAEALAEDW